MIRNKFHVFGDETMKIPYHLHFGKEMLHQMLGRKQQAALINVDTGDTLTFYQLARQSINIALSLTHIGVRTGDVISICSENRMEVIPTILGIICAGATYSPMDLTYGKIPLLHRMKIAKPKIMFYSPTAYDLHKTSFDSAGCIDKYIIYGEEDKDGGIIFKHFVTETADVAEFLPVTVDGWRDLLFILFSSGTTGLPKGVPWTHMAFLSNIGSTLNERWQHSSTLITREWYYTYGLLYTLCTLHAGSTVIYSGRNKQDDMLQALEKYKVQCLQCAPSLLNTLIKCPSVERYDVTSVQVIVSSSTAVMEGQLAALKKRLPNVEGVYQIYGMTEAGSVCNEANAPLGGRPGSVGTPSHGFIVKVVDIETRQPLGPKQRGEICFKSPSLMSGYLDIETRLHLDSEGFYKTGDVGWYDLDGYFYIVERLKEMIKCNDVSVAPAELESILLSHPAVQDAGVGLSGAGLAGAVVLRGGEVVGGDELQNYLNSRITFRMSVSRVLLVDALPRGPGDKLDRRALAQILSYTDTEEN